MNDLFCKLEHRINLRDRMLIVSLFLHDIFLSTCYIPDLHATIGHSYIMLYKEIFSGQIMDRRTYNSKTSNYFL